MLLSHTMVHTMTTQRPTPSTVKPTLEESMAAQARLRANGQLAAPQQEGSGVAKGCAMAFVILMAVLILLPSFIGGWVAFWGIF